MEEQYAVSAQPVQSSKSGGFPSPLKLITEAAALYKKRPLELIVLIIPFAFADGISVYLNSGSVTKQSIDVSTLWFLVFIYIIVTALTSIVYMLILPDDRLTIAEGYARAVKMLAPFIGLLALNGCIVVAGFIVLYLPGIYLSILFGFAQWIFVLEGTTIKNSFSLSRKYVLGHWWQIFLRVLFLYLITLLPGTIVVLLVRLLINLVFHSFNTAIIHYVIQGGVLLIIGPFFMSYYYLLYTYAREIYLSSQTPKQAVL